MSLNSRKKWVYVQPEEINSWPCLFFSHVQWTSREKLSTKSVSMAFCHIEFLSTFPRQPSMNCSRSFHPAVVNAQIQTREAAASSPHPLQAAVTRSFTHTQPVYLHSQRWNEAAGREIVPLHVFGSAQTRLELWQLFRHMLATDPLVSEENVWHERRRQRQPFMSWSSSNSWWDSSEGWSQQPAWGRLQGRQEKDEIWLLHKFILVKLKLHPLDIKYLILSRIHKIFIWCLWFFSRWLWLNLQKDESKKWSKIFCPQLKNSFYSTHEPSKN